MGRANIERLAAAFWRENKDLLSKGHQAFLFHGQIHRSPLLILGQNPGGRALRERPLRAEDLIVKSPGNALFDGTWRKQFAKTTRMMIEASLTDWSREALARVPVSNVCTFRWPSSKPPADRAEKVARSRSFLRRLIRLIRPTHIVILGTQAGDDFRGALREWGPTATTPVRAGRCKVWTAQARLTKRSRRIRIVCLPHPAFRLTSSGRGFILGYLAAHLIRIREPR